ncbi:MAG: hypothetical protein GX666_06900, partial [Tissierellia bacterium]|nr:hypothetical protein [Tissierellia bacterium]
MKYEVVEIEGVAPNNYHAMSIYPEYFKVDGKWLGVSESRMDTVPVIRDGFIEVLEFRNLKIGDKVIVGRTEDGSERIYLYTEGFNTEDSSFEMFQFRSGRTRETAFSKDYDELAQIMKYERANKGHIVWVLGSSISMDLRTRFNFSQIIKSGYVNAVITGNTMATVDLMKGLKSDNPFIQSRASDSRSETLQDYITISKVREMGSIENAVKGEIVEDGIMKTLVDYNIPFVIAGSISDRYKLPETYNNVYEAQDAMRFHTRKATMLICLSSVLFTIASGNMTPSYNIFNEVTKPIH